MIAKLESFVRRLTEDELFRQSAIKNPERAVDLVMGCVAGHRLPEPLHLADRLSKGHPIPGPPPVLSRSQPGEFAPEELR